MTTADRNSGMHILTKLFVLGALIYCFFTIYRVFVENPKQPPLSCKESFDVALRGSSMYGLEANKKVCAAEYAQWLAAVPPTSYTVKGGAIHIEKSVLFLQGIVAKRSHIYLSNITDAPQPIVLLKQGGETVPLYFRNDAQADTAFAEISDAIENSTSR